MKIRWKTLIISVLIPLLTGGIAALISKNKMNMFDTVNKPPLSPPQWLFPVAWTILYILMGTAAYLVFNTRDSSEGKKKGLTFYGIQLAFNFFWTIIFFNLEMYLFAFVWLVILLTLIIITAVKFSKVNKLSAYLLIPYILWVSFAGYLNFGIYLLN